jgi:hypothetical protein
MNMFIIDNEIYLRLTFFFAIFISMAIWEIVKPRRALTTSKANRCLLPVILPPVAFLDCQ